jgi:hypothetical protein
MFSSSTQSLTQNTPVFMAAVSQAPAVTIQARTGSVVWQGDSGRTSNSGYLLFICQPVE